MCVTHEGSYRDLRVYLQIRFFLQMEGQKRLNLLVMIVF